MQFTPSTKPLGASYIDMLSASIERETGLSRGELRRKKLLLAAAEVLQDEGYHGFRISHVLKKTGAARGTFYIYFNDKSDIAVTVLSDFRNCMFHPEHSFFKGQDWRQRIFLSNLYYAEVHEFNAGLLRSFYQFMDDAEDFRDMRHATEKRWMKRLYNAHEHVFGPASSDVERDEIMRCLHGLRVMVEALCMQVYVEPMPEMIALFPTPHHVAETATNMWLDVVNGLRGSFRASLDQLDSADTL